MERYPTKRKGRTLAQATASEHVSSMRFGIVGAGGVGGYFGGRLAQAGNDVTFIARGGHLEALQTRGLRIESPDGPMVINPVRATDEASSVGPVETVIVAVKTWQLSDAIESMRPLMGGNTAVLPLLNGVDASDQLADAFGEDRALNGLCRIISHRSAPGVVTHVGAVPTIVLGERSDARSERVEKIAAVLQAAGVTVDIPEKIQVALWTKLLFVVSLGGVGAVTRASTGVVRSTPESRQMLEGAMCEIRDVAEGRGVPLPEDIVETALSFIDGMPAQAMASLHRDIVDGRPSELDAWTGTVVRLGKEAKVPTPINACIFASLLPQERAARDTHRSA